MQKNIQPIILAIILMLLKHAVQIVNNFDMTTSTVAKTLCIGQDSLREYPHPGCGQRIWRPARLVSFTVNKGQEHEGQG